MDMITFVNYKDFAEYMHEKALAQKTVYAVLFYDDAKKLLKELACFDDTEITNVEIYEEMWKGYGKEFYIILDTNLNIYCEEAFRISNDGKHEYYANFGDSTVIALIDGDADSRVIKAAGDAECIEFEIKENFEDNFVLTEEQAEKFYAFFEYILNELF